MATNVKASILRGNKIESTSLDEKDDLFLIEAEDLDLETYLVEEREVASNEKVISLLGSGDTGTASTRFTGPSGLYTVIVGYYDEIDGESLFRLKVNNDLVDNWTADQELDPWGVPTENNFTRRTIGGIELKTGDVLAIEGFRDAEEYARVDFLQLIPSTVIDFDEEEDNIDFDEGWSFSFEDYEIEHQGNSVIDLTVSYDYVEGIGATDPFEYPEFTQVYNFIDDYLVNYPNETDYWEIVNKNLVDTLLIEAIPTAFGLEYNLNEVVESLR